MESLTHLCHQRAGDLFNKAAVGKSAGIGGFLKKKRRLSLAFSDADRVGWD